MSEPSAAMQKAILDQFMADATLATLMGGAVRVYDVVPPAAPFPYITIGDDQMLDEGNLCEPDLFEYFATIHVWSRPTPVGRIEAKNIAGRVREILKTLPTVIGFEVIMANCERTDHLRDPDGLSAHSVLTIRYMIGPLPVVTFITVAGIGIAAAIGYAIAEGTDAGFGPGVVSFSPADNAIEVSILTALIAVFNEPVFLNIGNVHLKKTSDNSVVESWDVATESGSTAGKVEIVGGVQLRMHPTANLGLNTGYYVIWDTGAVKNVSNEPVFAMSSATAWNFTTQTALAAAGRDILLVAGDSNTLFGVGFNAGLDVADADVDSLGYTSPNTNLVISSQEPLDYATQGVTAGYIGIGAHFMIDHYKQFGDLRSPRKGMICANGLGGSVVGAAWAAEGGSAGNPTAAGGGLLTISAARLDVCLGLAGSNAVIGCIDSDGVNGYFIYGTTFTPDAHRNFRWQYHRKIQWLRNSLGPTTPILFFMPTTGLQGGVNGTLFTRTYKDFWKNFPYTYHVDPAAAPAIPQSDIHYTAADHRKMALRCHEAFVAAKANNRRVVRWETDTIYSADGFAGGFTITNSGFDAAGDATGTWETIRATAPVRSGNVYVELEIVGPVSLLMGYIGLCNADFPAHDGFIIGSNPGATGGPAPMSAGQYLAGSVNDVHGFTKVWNGTITAGTVTGDRITLAVSTASGKAWIGRNGVWFNSGNPAAGTGEWISGIVDPPYIAASIYAGVSSIWRLHPRQEDFIYPVPPSFDPWDQADFVPPPPVEGGPTVGDGLLIQDGAGFLKLQDGTGFLVLEVMVNG